MCTCKWLKIFERWNINSVPIKDQGTLKMVCSQPLGYHIICCQLFLFQFHWSIKSTKMYLADTCQESQPIYILTNLSPQNKSVYWSTWNVGNDLIVLLIIFMERKYGTAKGPNLSKSSNYLLETKATLHIRTKEWNSNTGTN